MISTILAKMKNSFVKLVLKKASLVLSFGSHLIDKDKITFDKA